MEIIGPVLGIGAIIFSIVAGIVTIKLASAKIRQQERLALARDEDERDLLQAEVQGRLAELDQVTQRLSELEERVDFAERLLAQPREGQRLGPSRE